MFLLQSDRIDVCCSSSTFLHNNRDKTIDCHNQMKSAKINNSKQCQTQCNAIRVCSVTSANDISCFYMQKSMTRLSELKQTSRPARIHSHRTADLPQLANEQTNSKKKITKNETHQSRSHVTSRIPIVKRRRSVYFELCYFR